MKACKSLALLTAYIFLVITVSAQSGIGGAEMTVEESLTTFVTEVLGFPVSDASEVILFVVGPIIAFYFFLTNMMTMAFENFEDRIGRNEWEQKEELPTNLKLFSLITSFITVVTIGRFAPSLIVIFGALSLLLALMMFLDLFNWLGNNNNNNRNQDNQTGNNNQNNNKNNQNNPNNNQNNQNNQNNNGGNLGDVLSSLGNLGQTGYNIYQNWNQQASNPIQESLKYFQNDMLDESKKFFNNYNHLRDLISDAESQHSRSGAPDDEFRTVIARADDLRQYLEDYRDFVTNNQITQLEANHQTLNPSLSERAETMRNQFDNVVNGTNVPPPNDNLRELMNSHLSDLVAVGHFKAESPYSMAEIGSDVSKTQDVITVAESMGVLEDRTGRNELNEIQNLCYNLEQRDNPKILINKAINLAEKDLKIDQADYNYLETMLDSNGELIGLIDDIENGLSNLSNPPGNIADIEQNLTRARSFIQQTMDEVRTIENEVQQNNKFESEILKKLREIQSKI